MQKPSTLLYHDHILNNIEFLDKRKDGYVGHRLEFINQYCLPVRKRIQAIKQDIQFYENMRDTQYEVIEGEPDIMQLKKQIRDYTATNHYYENKLDQFDKFIAQLEVNLKERKKLLVQKRYQHKNLHFEKGSLSTIRSKSHIKNKQSITSISKSNNVKLQDRYLGQQRQETTSNYAKDSLQNSREQINTTTILDTDNDHQLPPIESKRLSHKYSQLTNQQKQMQRHLRNQHRLQKIINRQNNISLRNSIVTNPEKQQIELTAESIKDIKQTIIQFDHTEALFRECFERKKLSIQKSVSQLQSKLISNKELFLNACEVIGQKNGILSFEDFSQLTTDQITTLFISFSWLSRKVYNEFARKRKDIMEILKIIKSVQQK